jgi:hypothetical protein
VTVSSALAARLSCHVRRECLRRKNAHVVNVRKAIAIVVAEIVAMTAAVHRVVVTKF